MSLWLSTEGRLEAILPQGGVVCFVRFTNETCIELTKFYNILVNQFLTMVGPGHWFEMSDRYMRIGFGWTDEKIFKQGLTNISMAIDACLYKNNLDKC